METRGSPHVTSICSDEKLPNDKKKSMFLR